MLSELLPNNATPWEEAFADTLDTISTVSAAINSIRGTKLTAPPPSFLPFLVYEYGLGELRPYVPALYELIEQGIDWQRIRGTHAAVAKGLSFIGYEAAIEEALSRRKFWNSFQLRFPTLPPRDLPDLVGVDGIATLSVPKRSKLRRGVHFYDVGPLETDTTRLDRSMLDAESGVQLWENGPIWSFGRPHNFPHLLTQAEGELIGNWIDVSAESLTWADLTIPWTEANFPWTADTVLTREIVMAAWFRMHPLYIALRGASGVIGYRRVRSNHQVVQDAAGPIAFEGLRYVSSDVGRFAYISALTGFGDGAGQTATSVSILANAELAPGVPPGRLWLQPNDITAGDEIAVKAVNIPLRPTVREEVKFLLRF